MFSKFFKRKKECCRHHQHEHHKNEMCHNKCHHNHAKHHVKHKFLSNIEEGRKCIIAQNSDKQTIEMGLFEGTLAIVLKNNINDNNLIVGVGDTRLMIPKEKAEKIIVR